MTAAARFPVLFTPAERRQFPLCPRDVPLDMVLPHDKQAQANHGGQTLAVLASRGGLDPIELVCVLDDRAYPWDQVRADPAAVKQYAVAEVIKRAAAWERRGGLTAKLVPGFVWACGVCGMCCPAQADQTGVPPPKVQCSFCKTVHQAEPAEVPTPPPVITEDDPAAEAAGDPTHAHGTT